MTTIGGMLTNDFFVDLIELGTEWRLTSEAVFDLA